jgi:hypothetical protein
LIPDFGAALGLTGVFFSSSELDESSELDDSFF